jgi:hypothetical protein
VEKVGRHDNFFELGGHSLLAVRVISRTQDNLRAVVSIVDIFESPILSSLGDLISRQSSGLPFDPDASASVEDVGELSDAELLALHEKILSEGW